MAKEWWWKLNKSTFFTKVYYHHITIRDDLSKTTCEIFHNILLIRNWMTVMNIQIPFYKFSLRHYLLLQFFSSTWRVRYKCCIHFESLLTAVGQMVATRNAAPTLSAEWTGGLVDSGHLHALAGGSWGSGLGNACALPVEELAGVVDVVVLPTERGGPREVAPEAVFVGGVHVARVEHVGEGFHAGRARAAALREADAGQRRGTCGSLSCHGSSIVSYGMAQVYGYSKWGIITNSWYRAKLQVYCTVNTYLS